MMRIHLLPINAAIVLIMLQACTNETKPTPLAKGPDPLDTARTLLSLHGLVGKQPEEQSEKDRNKKVNRRLLTPLFTDLEQLDDKDFFISNGI